MSGTLRALAENKSDTLFRRMIPSAISSSSTPGVEDDRGLMIAKMVPLKRLGTPLEVATVALMYCKVGYCTGQVSHLVLYLRCIDLLLRLRCIAMLTLWLML